MAPVIALVAAGAMGAAVAAVLVKSGCTVLTNLDGRSESTHKRAEAAGMQDVPFSELVFRADYFLSILPPINAYTLAQKVVDTISSPGFSRLGSSDLVYADCNAVNPQTVKLIAALFDDTSVKFVDSSIIGGPPSVTYSPTFYASARLEDGEVLEGFVTLSEYGLKIKALRGEGVGVGDASALKMSYAGISKGMIGLFTTMILAAHASSSTTSTALLEELHASQPDILKRISRSVPLMIPKAYRWVGEMEEIAGFVGEDVPGNEIYRGLAQLYVRVEGALERKEGGNGEEIEVLRKFAEDAGNALT